MVRQKFLVTIATTTLALVGLMSAPAVASGEGPPEFERATTESVFTVAQTFDLSTSTGYEVEMLLNHYTGGSGLGFDIVRAAGDGATGDVILLGEMYNSFFEGGRSEERPQARGIKIPVYGNWCGPGHSGPKAPIDILDSLCRTHDRCYASKGYFNKSCDRALVNGIVANWSRMSLKQKAFGFVIGAAFSATWGSPNPVPGRW